MDMQHIKHDIQNTLSCFSEVFSRPSFKIFSSFVMGFIHLGKEAHTSAMVQALSCSFLQRSLSSFTRFLGNQVWAVEEVAEIAVQQFFYRLHIKAQALLFLIIDDTLAPKTGKHIPGCSWHKDHAHNLATVFGHQWVLAALLYRDFLLPLEAQLYHPRGTKGCGPFHTKIDQAKSIISNLRLPVPCTLYVLADSWYWAKTLVKACRKCGYHIISQLKSSSVLWIDGKKTKVTTLLARTSSYRAVCLRVYGKTRMLHVAQFIADIKEVGTVAVVVATEKRKKPVYVVSTNLHLSAIDMITYYAKRWKIEQMIKDLKQRLGFGDYQVRSLAAIKRHVAVVLLSYFVLVLLKILAWLRNKHQVTALSIRLLAFQVRKHILLEHITVMLRTMRIQFKQNILNSYLEQVWT